MTSQAEHFKHRFLWHNTFDEEIGDAILFHTSVICGAELDEESD